MNLAPLVQSPTSSAHVHYSGLNERVVYDNEKHRGKIIVIYKVVRAGNETETRQVVRKPKNEDSEYESRVK